MSATIDQRVVEMQFDNRQFENNVSTTMSTLDKLKQSLNLTGATKGLEEVDAAAKRIDLSGLSSAAEAVTVKFSYMQMSIQHQLNKIVDGAMNAGKQIINALAIDPIKTGFAEYETQINAVQTILANTESKGTTIDDVNGALDTLNEYADKTIYNFTEMTRNIGTFTAAGIDLDTSVNAIQGIANLAAVSGSNSQQASTAMYQLSQALSSGTVKLMDWNSVVNAGMGGQVFQDALKMTSRRMAETAKELQGMSDAQKKAYQETHGYTDDQMKSLSNYTHNIDELIEKNGSFRESLQAGWITADVLTETLSHFTMAAEKGSEQWNEYKKSLMDSGYTDAQAEEILRLSNTATDAATKVKTATQLWDTLKETAQSGWTQTWEIIVGDFEEAKSLFSMIYETLSPLIEAMSKSRNELLEGWAEAGGRDDVIQALTNAFQGLMNILTPIDKAFKEIFPPMTVDQLTGFTEGLKKLTDKFVLMEGATKEANEHNTKLMDTINKLARTFKGLFAFVDIVAKVIGALVNGFFDLIGIVAPAGGSILDLTAKIGDWLVNLNESIESTNIFNKTIDSITNFVRAAIDAVGKLVAVIKDKFVAPGLEVFSALIERISTRLGFVSDAASAMNEGVSSAFKDMGSALSGSDFLKMLMSLWQGVLKIGAGIGKAVGALTDGIINSISNADFGAIGDLLNTASLGAITVFISKFVNGFGSITDMFGEVGESIGSFKESTIGILESVRETFEAYQTSLKADALKKIAVAIAILAASILVMSLIDSAKLSGAIGAITMLFAELMGSMALFNKFGGDMKGMSKSITAMISISVAVLILAGALTMIGSLSFGQMMTGLIGIAALIEMMVHVSKSLERDTKTILKGTGQLILFAIAIKVLASAVTDLSSLNWEQLSIGLIGVIVLTAVMQKAFESLSDNKSKGMIASAASMILMGAAMKIMASAVQDLSTLNLEQMATGLTGVIVLTAVMQKALESLSKNNTKGMISSAVSLVVMGAAIKILASVVQDMSTLNFDQLLTGLVGVVALTLVMQEALKSLSGSNAGNMLGAAASMILAGAAIKILASAVQDIATLNWTQLSTGLTGVIVLTALLYAALTSMSGGNVVGMLGVAAAVMVFAAALAVLTPVLVVLGSMSWGSIIKGLVTIAAAIAILGVAGALLTPIIPSILGLAAAFALLGVGVVALGAGLTMIGVGLGAIATALSAGATAIVAGISTIIMGTVSLIPAIILELGEAVVAFFNVIVDYAPAFGEAVKALVLSLVDVLVECVPAIANGALELIVGLGRALVEYTPQIVEIIFDFIVGVLEAVAAGIPGLLKSCIDVVMSIFTGVIDALKGIDTSTLIEATLGIGLLAGLMLALSALASLIPGAMAGVLGLGVLIAELALVIAAIGALAQIPGLEWLISEGGDFLQVVGTAIGQFIGGIAGGFMSGMSSQFPKIGSDLSAFMENAKGFIDGASSITPEMATGVKTLVDAVLILTAANVLDHLTSFITGGASLSDFGGELGALGSSLNDFAAELGTFGPDKVTTITCAADAIKTMAQAAEAIPNSGGWAAKLCGENSIAAFGDQLPGLAQNLNSFATNLGTFGEDKVATVTCAVEALNAMTKAASGVDGQTGFGKAVFGDNSLGTFCEQLPDLAKNLKSFASNLGTFSEDTVKTVKCAIDALKALAGLADADLSGANDNLSMFGVNVANFASDISDFCSSLPAADTINAAADNIKKITSLINDIANTDVGSLSEFTDSLSSVGKNGVSAFVKAFTSNTAKTDVYKAAVGLMEEAIEGAESEEKNVKDAFEGIAAEGASAVSGKYEAFKEVGKHLVEGFAAGIKENTYIATARAKAMAKAAADTAEKELDIHSPSRVFKRIGEFVPKGFALGIDRYAGLVKTSVVSMTDGAVSSVSKSITRIADAVNADIDTQPTIRPVLDLSNIRSGAGMINDMFGMNPSVGVLAKVGAINASMNQIGQNGSNTEIVSAIDKLRGDIRNMERNQYNINGITYDDGSNVRDAVENIVRYARIERRK